MKGYKVFNKDLTCRGFQFKVGKGYKLDILINDEPKCQTIYVQSAKIKRGKVIWDKMCLIQEEGEENL